MIRLAVMVLAIIAIVGYFAGNLFLLSLMIGNRSVSFWRKLRTPLIGMPEFGWNLYKAFCAWEDQYR